MGGRRESFLAADQLRELRYALHLWVSVSLSIRLGEQHLTHGVGIKSS